MYWLCIYLKYTTLILALMIVVIRCQILRLKCTKFNFGFGGAYNAPPDPLAGFKEHTSKERQGRGRKEKGDLLQGQGDRRPC